MVTVLGHRGCVRVRENSLHSIHKLTRYYKKDDIHLGVEFDVQMTKDNIVVCYHDRRLKRLYGIHNKLKEMTYADIKRYNICTLESTLVGLSRLGHNRTINIELKYYNKKTVAIFCKKVIHLVKKYKLVKNTVLTSFSSKIVRNLLNKKSGIRVGFIKYLHVGMNGIKSLVKRGLASLVVDKRQYKKGFEIAKKYNINLMIYTIFENDKITNYDISILKKADYLNSSKVGLITDNMDALISYIDNFF